MSLVKNLNQIPDIEHTSIEEEISEFLKKEFYLPLMEEFKVTEILKNSAEDDIGAAIQSNKIRWNPKGYFEGSFNTSKLRNAFKSLRAKFKNNKMYLDKELHTSVIKSAISISEARFLEILKNIQKKLSKTSGGFIVDNLNLQDHFDKGIWKLNSTFEQSVKGISVPPRLSESMVRTISEEYTRNTKISLQQWSNLESSKLIKKLDKLRTTVQSNFYYGDRYDALAKTLEKSFDFSRDKAKFIAKQETKLLSAKFRETRYKDSGIEYYIWTTVNGTADHPVRDLHQKLDGTIQRWDDPPVSGTKGERQHPGEPFNCRCIARPVVFSITEEMSRIKKKSFNY